MSIQNIKCKKCGSQLVLGRFTEMKQDSWYSVSVTKFTEEFPFGRNQGEISLCEKCKQESLEYKKEE